VQQSKLHKKARQKWTFCAKPVNIINCEAEVIIDYHRGHNSVTELPFQISQNLPQSPLPLHEQITPNDLRKLIEKNSATTLHELCEPVQKQCGIKMSITAMCRLVRRHHIERRRSHRPRHASLPLAA